ncbi:MAG: hypothetical protein A2202_08895 [Bdellovibrionales bacterium RIFOXYA1_FULL_36_14]|nr:MAG: hypothetical protein A2202_08895 [Bdellovibrionales bacterium RIFOXYA1_FULL_36_14]
MHYDVVASIVTYNNSIERVIQTARSFLDTSLNVRLVIIDNNSPDKTLEKLQGKIEADFIQTGRNGGYSFGHNHGIDKYPNTEFYLVLNPDVTIHPGALEELVKYMRQNDNVGMISPQILNPDGSIQYLCKQNPTLFAQFLRRFLPSFLKKLSTYKRYMDWYEMRETGYNGIFQVPYLSGCFMFFRSNILHQIGKLDENFFMYLEDADITRRVNQISRAIYFPYAQITHDWHRGSYKSLKLTLISIKSSIYYFQKWGTKLF